jgi:hypothetical protein
MLPCLDGRYWDPRGMLLDVLLKFHELPLVLFAEFSNAHHDNFRHNVVKTTSVPNEVAKSVLTLFLSNLRVH